ncbi:hypothetical protein MWU54_05665 [Marivita sp. S6314]|uniref:hypothetical protein n=1 Tax=Marivita sp. S6314 TaxID=2926406 RepID=UPI001FF3F5EA|nr:hypothetical protein [Marivita sp. S6314]MCK0149500.1 hypothetical protein [Marivita sp. S6314]
MTRIATAFVLSLIASSALAEVDWKLEMQLEQYFEQVNMTALPEPAREKAWDVLTEEASYEQTFFRLHSLLDRHDALVHVDMHGATHAQIADNR